MKKKAAIKPKKTVTKKPIKKSTKKRTSRKVVKKQSAWEKFYLWLHDKLSSLAFWK